ncbi:MAG: acyl carrier protein [Actinobacteria bacterium]|nr:acyl carrier protein [Actinomycetota bacterium]
MAERLLRFLADRTKIEYTTDEDLFARGGISSLFAMELVLHLEQQFGVAVPGPELTMDNFRTVQAMAALVRRLQGGEPNSS